MWLSKFVHDLYTGPDGETWALGRVYSVPLVMTACAVPIYQLYKGLPVSLSELAILLPATSAGVGGMVAIMNHTDTPGGVLIGGPPR